MQVQTINEFSQVKTRVDDTYCSHHHHFSSLIVLTLTNIIPSDKVNISNTRLKSIYFLYVCIIIDHFHIQLN
jgi:hypothetical protein